MAHTFPGGILYIQLGNDSHISHVISGIAKSVQRTGGERLACTIHALQIVEEALEIAGQWFEGQRCLFLVDDVWEVNGITPYELRKLGTMLNDESLLVYTSRVTAFEEAVGTTVVFRERDAHGQLAQNMLMNHADIGSYADLNSANKKAVNGVLETCQDFLLLWGLLRPPHGTTARKVVISKKSVGRILPGPKVEGRKHCYWEDKAIWAIMDEGREIS